MGKPALSEKEVNKIVELRKTGHSLSEIRKIVPRGRASVFKYMRHVCVLPEYKEVLRIKQGGSKNRSMQFWNAAKERARSLVPNLEISSKTLILSCLYWGEGNKNELSLINSDPGLIKIFMNCLLSVGVKKDDLKITLRIFEDLSRSEAVEYWSKVLEIERTAISNVNVINGKKKGKLKYGMCRVRVKKGHEYFKLIISVIDLLRTLFNAPVVQRIEQPRPKW